MHANGQVVEPRTSARSPLRDQRLSWAYIVATAPATVRQAQDFAQRFARLVEDLSACLIEGQDLADKLRAIVDAQALLIETADPDLQARLQAVLKEAAALKPLYREFRAQLDPATAGSAAARVQDLTAELVEARAAGEGDRVGELQNQIAALASLWLVPSVALFERIEALHGEYFELLQQALQP
jgi:hypothetical protein